MSHVPDFKGAQSASAGGGGAAKRVGSAVLTRRCVFRVIRVSGTIRKAEEEAIRKARREVLRLRHLDEVGVLARLVGDVVDDSSDSSHDGEDE